VETPVIGLPFKGQCGSLDSPGHDRYAYDFVPSAPGKRRKYVKGSFLKALFLRVRVERFHGWSTPIVAPCDGIVKEVHDGWPDRIRIGLIRDAARMIFAPPKQIPNDIRPFAGNYIVIEREGMYIMIAHLRNGPAIVAEGQAVEKGQMIGEVGNSGNSLMPHIHFQVMDATNLPALKIIPFKADGYEVYDKGWKKVENDFVPKGELIRGG